MSVQGRRNRAFTLIELLIVVAIIAILAAIAVPNFLEAQLRSKVARVKSDMRTVATALEAYSIDWNGRYPYLKAYVEDATIWGARHHGDRGGIYLCTMLSTPIAFLTTTAFEDPFNAAKKYNQFWQIDPNLVGGDDISHSLHFNNTKLFASVYYSPRDSTPNRTTAIQVAAGRPLYSLISFGPDGVKGPKPGGGTWSLGQYMTDRDATGGYRFPEFAYDPSNGTVSNGDIIRMP